MKRPIFVLLLFILSGGLARAGGFEGGSDPGPLLAVIGFLGFCFLPIASLEGAYSFGSFSPIQIPVILGLILAGVLVLRMWRYPKRLLLLPVFYVGFTMATNLMAQRYLVDHSGDFPIGQALDRLDWRDKPAETDIRRVAGLPLAEGFFSAGDSVLPDAVRKNMNDWKRENGYILAYHEQDGWGGQWTYYVLLDPQSRERYSQVGMSGPASREYWPWTESR